MKRGQSRREPEKELGLRLLPFCALLRDEWNAPIVRRVPASRQKVKQESRQSLIADYSALFFLFLPAD